MVDVSHKKCITCNNKRANLNYTNEKQALYCNDCKKCGMNDIRSKICIICNSKYQIPIIQMKNKHYIVMVN